MNFTTDEYQVLIESLDTWVDKDALGSLMGAMIGGVLLKDEAKKEWETKQKVKEQLAVAERTERKEIATLIKAKLIALKRGAVTA